MEAVADCTLYEWYVFFGYRGTPNVNNSLLQKSLCDGTLCENDFQFVIGGETFDELWFLVDDIYLSLSRFMKPLSVPLNDPKAIFSMWQESKRKDIKLFFCVLKKSFTCLQGPLSYMILVK